MGVAVCACVSQSFTTVCVFSLSNASVICGSIVKKEKETFPHPKEKINVLKLLMKELNDHNYVNIMFDPKGRVDHAHPLLM